MQDSKQHEYERAHQRASRKFRFYQHFAVYAAVIVFLAVVNLFTSSGYLWFIWPMLGWGVFVAMHAVRTFVLSDENAIIEQMTARELDKQRSDQD